jgi:hypothetical protein
VLCGKTGHAVSPVRWLPAALRNAHGDAIFLDVIASIQCSKLHALSDQEYSLMLAQSASFCDFFAGFSNMQMRSLRYAVVLKRQLLRYRNTCAADCFAK